MKAFSGKASAVWKGARNGGKGTRNGGKGALTTSGPVLTGARFGSGGQRERQSTHPSELIAAAHAASFAMTLASELATSGYPPGRIETTATVTTEHAASRWTITRIHLEVVAAVRAMEQSDFVDTTLRARANCPVSRLVIANISMEARLERGASR